jgi:hypothetical protein
MEIVTAVTLVALAYVVMLGLARFARRLLVSGRIGWTGALMIQLAPIWVGLLIGGFVVGWSLAYIAVTALVIGSLWFGARIWPRMMGDLPVTTNTPTPKPSKAEAVIVLVFGAVPGFVMLVVLVLILMRGSR